jgi:Putative esterase
VSDPIWVSHLFHFNDCYSKLCSRCEGSICRRPPDSEMRGCFQASTSSFSNWRNGDKLSQQSKHHDKYILFAALILLPSLYLELLASINSAKMSVTTKATIASFGGKLLKLSHNASTVGCEMAFNLYLPPQATTNAIYKVPLLIYLSGLTCTPDNCSEKGFFQHGASKRGIAVLYPDTSPSKHKEARRVTHF